MKPLNRAAAFDDPAHPPRRCVTVTDAAAPTHTPHTIACGPRYVRRRPSSNGRRLVLRACMRTPSVQGHVMHMLPLASPTYLRHCAVPPTPSSFFRSVVPDPRPPRRCSPPQEAAPMATRHMSSATAPEVIFSCTHTAFPACRFSFAFSVSEASNLNPAMGASVHKKAYRDSHQTPGTHRGRRTHCPRPSPSPRPSFP